MGQAHSSVLYKTLLKDTGDKDVALNAALLVEGIRQGFWVKPTVNRSVERVKDLASYLLVDSQNQFQAQTHADGSVWIDCKANPSSSPPPPKGPEYYRFRLFVEDECFYEGTCPLPLSKEAQSETYEKVMNIYRFATHLDEDLAIRVAFHVTFSPDFMQILHSSQPLTPTQVDTLNVLLDRNGFHSIVQTISSDPSLLTNHNFRTRVLYPLLSFTDSDLFNRLPEDTLLKDEWAKSLLSDYHAF